MFQVRNYLKCYHPNYEVVILSQVNVMKKILFLVWSHQTYELVMVQQEEEQEGRFCSLSAEN